MAQVGRQRQHPLVDIHALLVPQHQPANGEAVAQIVHPRLTVTTPIDPPELPAQLLEDPVDLSVAHGLTQYALAC